MGKNGSIIQAVHSLAHITQVLDLRRTREPFVPSCHLICTRARGRVELIGVNFDLKGLALLSGGLDSALAVKLMQKQGIEVHAVNFTSPFCLCGKGGCGATALAKKLGISLKIITLGGEYLEMLKNPEHGFGKNMNPCIDCRIFMLKKAKVYAQEIDASFLFTGEVLHQRPMSQNRRALSMIEKESALEGKILRPLSAKLLPETEAEKKGLIDRERLLDMSGRSRKLQMQLAKQWNLKGYSCPAGGCLLTYKEFASKVRDLINHNKDINTGDISLLKIGRHFRLGKNKIIVGRNEHENERLRNAKAADDYTFEVPHYGSPITLLQGPKTREAIKVAAALTLRYSDKQRGLVRYGEDEMEMSITASTLQENEIKELRIK